MHSPVDQEVVWEYSFLSLSHFFLSVHLPFFLFFLTFVLPFSLSPCFPSSLLSNISCYIFTPFLSSLRYLQYQMVGLDSINVGSSKDILYLSLQLQVHMQHFKQRYIGVVATLIIRYTLTIDTLATQGHQMYVDILGWCSTLQKAIYTVTEGLQYDNIYNNVSQMLKTGETTEMLVFLLLQLFYQRTLQQISISTRFK